MFELDGKYGENYIISLEKIRIMNSSNIYLSCERIMTNYSNTLYIIKLNYL